MPTVDFTLEDIRRLMKEEIQSEREYTREMIAGEFMSFWDNNLGPAFQDLYDEFHGLEKKFDVLDKKFTVLDKRFTVLDKKFDGVGRVVGQHSKDIMELRAGRA